MKLTYSRITDTLAPLMYGASDSDWATTDIDERRSCIGFLIWLSGAAIFWLTRFWKPCLSSFEGEVGALTEAAKNAIAVRELLMSIPISWYQVNKDIPTTILIDASAAKQATDNPKHYSRAKHMETFLAWIRHAIKEGYVRSQKVPREDNSTADAMVKPQVKLLHRASTRAMMGPHQNLKIKLSGGESLKRRLEDINE